jgi:tetratricopeptide (TPR) repeat protein
MILIWSKHMKNFVVILTLVASLGATGCSLAQDAARFLPGTQIPPGGSHIIPMTPALKARFVQAVRLMRSAQDETNAGQFAQAEADARQSITLCPGLGVQSLLAESLAAQGKTQEAIQEYQVVFDAGAVAPGDVLPYALLLVKTGQWAHAVQAYNRQLPYNGGDAALVQAYSDFTPDQPRSTDMEVAIEIDLGMDFSWYGYHGTSQEKTQQALAHFQKALALEPDSPLANYYYGYGLQRMGQRQEAQAAFKKAADLDESDGDVKAAAEAALAGR